MGKAGKLADRGVVAGCAAASGVPRICSTRTGRLALEVPEGIHVFPYPLQSENFSMQIANRHAVSFHYTLTDDQGNVIDSSDGREPLAYIHGEGHIVPGLEKALEGRSAGDQFKVDVAPEEGYGPRHAELIQVVPRAAFQGVEDLQPGMQFQGRNDQGSINVTVSKIEGDNVTVDGNHPLAGQTLHFAVEITNVREASDEELSHGHVHGEGGHHH